MLCSARHNWSLRGRRAASTCAVHLHAVRHAATNPLAGQSTPPLVVFHGLLGAASNWRLITRYPAIMAHRDVILAELRNHGQSAHADDMQWESLAADTVQLLDRLQINQCALLGHSLGGKMAMATSLLHPARVAKLVRGRPIRFKSRACSVCKSAPYHNLCEPLFSSLTRCTTPHCNRRLSPTLRRLIMTRTTTRRGRA